MAITTIQGHVNRALDFFNKSKTYFAIGRPTPWTPNDMNPPNEDPADKQLSTVIGYKKVETIYMVRPVVGAEVGEISYRDEQWKIVPIGEALEQGARWVYIDCTIRYDELPLGFYRQVGIYTGLTLAAGVSPSKYNLLPAEVLSSGSLEVIDNRQPSNRQIDQKEKLSLVLEF